MSFFRLRTVLFSTAAVAGALVAGTSAPALAAASPDAPFVVSAQLLSSEGAGCNQPAVHLGDGALDVEAQTDRDVSLIVEGRSAIGAQRVDTGCLLRVRLQLNQPARVRADQYMVSGSVSTSAGTRASHHFESSLDSTHWYGERATLPAGAYGPFYQGGGSPRFDPWSNCATVVDLSFRVGLSLASTHGLLASDSAVIDAERGARASLAADSSDCS
jgi:hypothetical protein